MSGSLRGRVDSYHLTPSLSDTSSTTWYAQEVFVNLYNTFKVHPNMTEIARYGGTGGTALNVNYWDQPNPFLNNAWCVFRMNTLTENPAYQGVRQFPWYILLQWSRAPGGQFGTAEGAGGSPGLINGNTGGTGNDSYIGIQIAIGVGGDENPWNGGGTLGANTKGTPVWKTPTGGTGVHVWPRSNNPEGSHNTNKENCTTIYSRNGGSLLPLRANVILDDDALLFLYSFGDLDTYQCLYFGPFEPAPGLSLPYPYVMLNTGSSTLPFNVSAVLGNKAGTTATYATNPGSNLGGIVGPSGKVVGCQLDRYTNIADIATARNPNSYFDPPAYSEFPFALYAYEFPSDMGYAGQVDFIREVSGATSYVRNGSSTRAIFGGSADVSTLKLSIPWPVGVVPRSGYQRTGIAF